MFPAPRKQDYSPRKNSTSAAPPPRAFLSWSYPQNKHFRIDPLPKPARRIHFPVRRRTTSGHKCLRRLHIVQTNSASSALPRRIFSRNSAINRIVPDLSARTKRRSSSANDVHQIVAKSCQKNISVRTQFQFRALSRRLRLRCRQTSIARRVLRTARARTRRRRAHRRGAARYCRHNSCRRITIT